MLALMNAKWIMLSLMYTVQGKTNFFERRVSEYAKAGVGRDSSQSSALQRPQEFKLCFDEEF